MGWYLMPIVWFIAFGVCLFICCICIYPIRQSTERRKASSISTFHMQSQDPTSTNIKSKHSMLPPCTKQPIHGHPSIDTEINYGTLDMDKLDTMYSMRSSSVKNGMEFGSLHANAIFSPDGPKETAESPFNTLGFPKNTLMPTNQEMYEGNAEKTGFMRMNWRNQKKSSHDVEKEDVVVGSMSYGQYGTSVFDAKSMMLPKVKSVEMLQINELFGTNSTLVTDESDLSENDDQDDNDKEKQVQNIEANLNENVDDRHGSLAYIKPNTVKFLVSNVHTMKPLPFYKHKPSKSIGINAIKPNMVKNTVNKFKQFDESSSSDSESSSGSCLDSN